MRSCLQSKVNDNSPPLYASNGISAIGSFCKDGICPCPTRGISIIMESSAVFPKNQLLFLVCFICFLCLVCLACVGKQKDVRHKSDGDKHLPAPENSFHRPRGGPPPSKREVWGFAGQGLRPCRRLHIGALRSPLSPFARPLETSYTTPGAGSKPCSFQKGLWGS